VIDVVPRIEASEVHQRVWEFSIIGEKEFFNTIGAKRTFGKIAMFAWCQEGRCLI
jgi:hypothetical protein